MIELKGGTLNPIFFHEEKGVVTKGYETGNGVVRDPHTRRLSEIISLKTIRFAPSYLGQTEATIFMSFVNGEKSLDEAVHIFPEPLRYAIFQTAGETLKEIHRTHQKAVPHSYHEAHTRYFCDLVNATKERLNLVGIPFSDLLSFLLQSYDPEEVNKRGIVWTHGDYWLNNLIGEEHAHKFTLNGVIDWELAGYASPYKDFSLVKMSIEDVHEGSSAPFWQGYGSQPQKKLQTHFAIMKTLEWIAGEPKENPLNSSFYEQKFKMIRRALLGI